MFVAIWLALTACIVASYCDVRARRIPNWLTGALALSAIFVHAFGGVVGLGTSLAVMAALTAAGTLIYSRGGIGGGDVKLAIAASGMLSYPLCVPFLLYSAIGGGLLALAFIATRSRLRFAFARVLLTLSGVPIASDRSQTLPYALAFAFGAALVALAQSVAPFLRITPS